ncbi:anaphase-promoting complex subunit [Achlya hypogyna]|uniref:Anaphase-promoting complex subunit 2 n=1 Tax=Achlya hypogyna TaxID=1202772 RepID=A0A1V9YW18_ACHHY|nr:anaphase-promoting complex subunit [Achlya hypogyna]
MAETSLASLQSLAAFPFQSQRMLIECQTQIFRDHSRAEFWARFDAAGVPPALAYAVETIDRLEEVAAFLQATTTHGRPIISILKAHFRAILFHDAEAAQTFGRSLEALGADLVASGGEVQGLSIALLRRQLQYLEWFQLTQQSLLNVFLRQIDAKADALCRGEFSEPCLEATLTWVRTTLLPRAEALFCPTQATIAYQDILSLQVYEAFVTLRIKELFAMVKDFPESLPGVADLANALARTHRERDLVGCFRQALQARLLQPGVATNSIIDLYTRTIKTFRILDDRGVLLEGVSGLIDDYLKKRKDTVRCIVASLTDDQNGDLFEELGRDGMDGDPDEWQPDPIEADPRKTARSRAHDDILSILVNIYGTKELFVNEYRLMLADRLLLNKEYQTDRDLRTLELLKLRFGDEPLQQCDIMVKDVEESKRVQTNVPSVVDATIVSEHFWPPFQAEDVQLHPRLLAEIDAYKKSYHVLKNPRTLEWVPSLGSVELELELNDHVIAFTCTPIQATIIAHFQDTESWAVAELALAMEMDEAVLQRHALFWVHQGVLSATDDTLQLQTAFAPRAMPSLEVDVADSAVSSDRQLEQEVEVLQSYIIGMLSNFESLPLARIHTMLSTFARSGPTPYDKTTAELAAILRTLVTRGRLEYIGGQYQLQK